jgi:hypothetical protein
MDNVNVNIEETIDNVIITVDEQNDTVLVSVSDAPSLLEDLSDTDIDSPANGESILYNSTTGLWENGTVAGSGDMLASVYDPTLVAGDAFNMDNMAEGTDTKILTTAERAEIAANTSKVSFPEAPNDGQEYVRKSEAWAVATGGGGGTWGAITGTLSSQTDLQNALNNKIETVVSGDNIININITDPKNPEVTILISGPYGDDIEAEAGGVAVGGIYYKREETGQGGLIAIRLT